MDQPAGVLYSLLGVVSVPVAPEATFVSGWLLRPGTAPRTAVFVSYDEVDTYFQVNLPANGDPISSPCGFFAPRGLTIQLNSTGVTVNASVYYWTP